MCRCGWMIGLREKRHCSQSSGTRTIARRSNSATRRGRLARELVTEGSGSGV